ncbi:MAG: T9SS type A sorting domain-containing protein, partial [Cryomorphaceae bacterium]|nr:T9SS type A sorting domain-containing protein [Cryomorphaceae bacterium]
VLRPIAAVQHKADGSIYIGNFKTGLIRVRDGSKVKRFLPPSPYSDRSYKVIGYGQGRNFTYSTSTEPGGPESFGGVILAPGALTDLWTKTFVADGASVYSGQDWTNFGFEKLYSATDIVDAAFKISATGASELYLSSWGKGLIKLEGMSDPSFADTVAFYGTTNTGGVLKGVGGNASDLRTGGITFDENGTLWGVQSLVSTPLYSIDEEGNFSAYSLSPGADAVALKDVIAKDGMVFIQSRTNGLYGYSESGGVGIKRQVSSGVGNGNLPSDKVLSMAFDNDGELWIGTDEGLVVLYSPENVFDGTGNRDARPILFEEEGVVQKLLGENPVSAIHVDGGNQKWLGTRGAGLFLVSPDGLRTIHQFTAENSPLLSNTILSIATDPTTGEVLIATDAGLIGFRGDATPGYNGYYPELHIYPNPVRPGYEGPIFIQGNSEDARIKVTDVSGALVYDMQAAGGQAQWDGTKLDGHPVASGVYIIYATDDLGEVTAQGKVLIVR